MNKRGLSDVVATVLIVLLALAAVAIVWSVISNTIGETGSEITLTNLCVQSEAKPTNCVTSSSTKVNVTVQLLRGANVKEVVGVVTFNDNKVAIGKANAPPVLSTALTEITKTTAQTPVSAKAAVVVQDDEGNTKTCDESPVEMTCTGVAG